MSSVTLTSIFYTHVHFNTNAVLQYSWQQGCKQTKQRWKRNAFMNISKKKLTVGMRSYADTYPVQTQG